MRLWLAKNNTVPVREQLATQIMLGVVSGDLAPGQKLPSTRELARRLQIHANTVSAAYHELQQRGWLAQRRGSGVYVCDAPPALPQDNGTPALDQLIAEFLRQARAHGYAPGAVRERLAHWLQVQPPVRFLVIEADPELRAILVAEVQAATGWPVRGAAPPDVAPQLDGAFPLALYRAATPARAALPPDTDLLLLHSRSLADAMTGQRKPAPAEIVTIVSHWPDFLRWAHTVLVAAGLDADTLVFRDAHAIGWDKGLRASSLIITDSLTAGKLPAGLDVRVFPLIADASLDELRRLSNFDL